MALLIEVKIFPSSGRQAWTVDKNHEKTHILRCYLKSAPEKGKANAELIKLLSKTLKIPQNKISIITGSKTRKKKLRIDDNISYAELCQKLIQAKLAPFQLAIWIWSQLATEKLFPKPKVG